MIDEVYKLLVEKTKSTPGAKVENNKFCLSVHFRCVDEKVYARFFSCFFNHSATVSSPREDRVHVLLSTQNVFCSVH